MLKIIGNKIRDIDRTKSLVAVAAPPEKYLFFVLALLVFPSPLFSQRGYFLFGNFSL